MKEKIKISCKGRDYEIPNQWSALSPSTWLRLVENYLQVENGQLSVGELRIRLLCDIMGWQWRKMRSEETIANLIVLSEQLTFPFKIAYQDKDILNTLSNEQYAVAIRTEPEHIKAPWAEMLQNREWHYQLDLCFFHQLLPMLQVGDMTYYGYQADCHHDALSTSITALRFIEATEALQSATTDASAWSSLARLAAILYAPEPYDSNQAHAMAEDFGHLMPVELQAIRMNFEAICNFLYTKTAFSLLTKFEKNGKTKSITTTMQDALYDLCHDGLGNSHDVERLNVLTYLRILRKKTIDTVRQMHGMDADIAKIANETGLPPEIITEII